MAIELISTLKQKNNGEFGLIDSNDVIGGFYQADTITERNSIPSQRRKEGMFCWVTSEKLVYQLVDGITNDCWIEFKDEIHSHDNKDILDNITEEKVDEWDNKSTFNGDYNSLTNKPTIPSIDGLASEEYVEEKLDEFKDEIHSHDNKDILDNITEEKVDEWDNKSDFSGSYDDLTDKPTIPSIDGLASEEYVDDTMGNLELIETSTAKPTNSQVSIWINTSEGTSVSALAKINDNTVADNTTWSSDKLNDLFIEMRNAINELRAEIIELHGYIDDINN